jgi:Tfp pilus assembly protein PilV
MGNKLTMNTISKRKLKSPAEGFTLIEVLAGIIVATAFVLITSQAIAISALYRVRAQRESLAWLWIQENFEEDVKFEVSQLSKAAAKCTEKDENGNYVYENGDSAVPADGYAQALITQLGAADGVATTESPELLNKAHTATRILGVKDEAPYNVMTVSYEVRDPDMGTAEDPDGKVIASFYTEVIPDAVFNCD